VAKEQLIGQWHGLLVTRWSRSKQTYGSSKPAWSKGWQPPGAVLHSSHEPDELLQCFQHDEQHHKVYLGIINYYYYQQHQFVTTAQRLAFSATARLLVASLSNQCPMSTVNHLSEQLNTI